MEAARNTKNNIQSLYLALGYLCNHSCRFCPCGKDNRKNLTFDTDKILKEIDTVLKKQEIKFVTLSGGEPTIQPCFLGVLERLADTTVNIEILSNAETLSDKTLIEQIASVFPAKRLSVLTAFHSHIGNKHEMINGSPGSFQKSIKGLHQLEEFGISYNIKHVLNNYSYKQLPEFVRWVYDEFPKAEYLILTGMDLCGVDRSRCSEVAVSCKEAEPWLDKAISQDLSVGNEHRPEIMITDFPMCRIDPIYWKMVKLRKGNKTSSYIGLDEKGSGFSEIEKNTDCAPFFRSCESCDVRPICPGLWRSSCLYFGEQDVSPIHLKVE